MRIERTYIHLNNFKVYAYHGVGKQEQVVGNEYIINLKIKVSLENAAKSDLLKETISYANICQEIHTVMRSPAQLLEHVAYKIANHLLATFPIIEELQIKLDKRNPPMGEDIDSAGVEFVVQR